MIAKENQVYGAAMQFCRTFSEPIPEAVIYGYAKLLSMDEKQVQNFVSEDCMDDLEAAHKWFSDSKLDLNLIKSGLLLIVPIIPRSVVEEKQNKFKDFIELEEKNTSSKDILQKALECSFVPFMTLFAEGNELKAVFAFQTEVKEKYASEREKEQEEKKSQTDEKIDNNLDEVEENLEEKVSSESEKKESKKTKENTM